MIARETNGTSSGGALAATSFNISLGSGVSNGDMVVVAIFTTAIEGVTGPAGYNLQAVLGTAAGAMSIYTHLWQTGDATSGITFTLGASNVVWATAAYVGVAATPVFYPHQAQGNTLSTTATSPSTVPTTSTDMLLMIYGGPLNETYSAPSEGSINVQASETTLASICIADFLLSSNAATGNQTITLSTGVANIGAQITLPDFQAYPTPPAPPVPLIITNFSRRVWPVGFWNSRVVSAAKPVGPSAARAIPIAAILRNWSPWLSPIPTWTPSLFNAANPPAIPSPNAVPITAILANFSMKPLRVPGFGTGFNSSFPLAFPTPPAPNIPAILANFSTRVFPQGFIQGWNFSVPLAFPTPPAPNIPQILSNFGPRVLVLPSRFPYETPVIIVPSSPSSGSILPIAQIIRAWEPQRVFPPIGSGSKSSAPAIVPVSSLLAALPIRQILAAWQSPFVVPPGGISPSPFTPIPSFPSAWIPLWLTEPIPAGPPAGPDQAIIIFQERIESVTPSLMVQIYSSSSIIPRSSAVTVTAKVTLPDGINPIPGMLPVLYIYSPGDVLVQQQTMNPTGDKTLFQLPYFIQPTAPTGAWAIQVVSQLDNLALDSGIIENAFQVT